MAGAAAGGAIGGAVGYGIGKGLVFLSHMINGGQSAGNGQENSSDYGPPGRRGVSNDSSPAHPSVLLFPLDHFLDCLCHGLFHGILDG